jgi:hypothetical protein
LHIEEEYYSPLDDSQIMDKRTINVLLAIAIAVIFVAASIPTPSFSQAGNEQNNRTW